MLFRQITLWSMLVGIVAATPAMGQGLHFNPFPNPSNLNNSYDVQVIVPPYIAADGYVWAGSHPTAVHIIAHAQLIHEGQYGVWVWGNLRRPAPQFNYPQPTPLSLQQAPNPQPTNPQPTNPQPTNPQPANQPSPNQKTFDIKPKQKAFPVEFVLINAYTGKALDCAAFVDGAPNGADVRGWSPSGQKNQIWFLEAVGAGHYRLRNGWSGKYLDNAIYEGNPNGSKVHIWKLNGQQNQVWAVESAGGNRYRFRNDLTGKYLDNAIVEGNPDGSSVYGWEDNGQENQVWRLMKP